MKATKFMLLATIGIGAIIITGCGQKKEKTLINTEKDLFVEVQPLQKHVLSNILEYTANLEAWDKVDLAPASPGRIMDITVDIGDHVNAGQLLIQMDPTQYNQARLQYAQLQVDYKRMDSLVKVGAISRQQYDQIKTQYDVAKNNVEFLEKNVFLKAPFNGVVTDKYFEEGELFSGTPTSRTGKAAIITLQQLNVLKAYVDIPERYYNAVKVNTPAEIQVDALGDKIFKGKVSKVFPTIDPISRSYRVEIKIDNPGEVLRPGMFARVKIDMGTIEALAAPSIAVLKLQGTNNFYLFKIENDIAKQIFVERGRIIDNYTEIISSNINEGDNIVVVGQDKLYDGAKVNVVNKK
jgi:RND family efflux transporter MFP subunit